jgi:hypothetical protein
VAADEEVEEFCRPKTEEVETESEVEAAAAPTPPTAPMPDTDEYWADEAESP